MIAAEGLEARAGDFVLRADLAVPAGASCAVIGPSGGGKSTLLLALAGFAPTTAGRVALAGREMGDAPPAERPATMLFQDHNLFPDVDVLRNATLGLRPSLSPTAAERAKAEAALERVGLGGLGARLPGQLSGGQRQRAALARALLRDRPVLLLDEPFAALGPAQRRAMLALTLEIARPRGAAVLLVTHDPEDAAALDLLAFCAAGRIDQARPAAAALAAPEPALAAYLGRA